MSPKGRFLLTAIGIICLSWLSLTIISNSAFIKRIIAEQSCPLVISMDGKVHGTQNINPNSSDSVFNCSTLDIIVASDGEVIVNSYKDGDNTTNGDYGATLLVNNLKIEQGGKVTADGRGYIITDPDNPSGNGGTASGESGGSGGANGGFGGEGVASDPYPAAPGGIAYGNAEIPIMLGGSGSNSGTGGLGGAGGGAIKIVATENVEIYGSLTANGLDGVTDNNSSGGGGAGGSIWIESNSLAGNGLVQAIGGISQVTQYGGGGGGGGRVIMFCNATNTYTGSYSVAAGDPISGNEGGVGTISGPTCRPHIPTVLRQFKMDQTTELPVGAPTSEGQFMIFGDLVDPDSHEQLTLQVEIRPIGTPFINTLTHAQTLPLSNPQLCQEILANCGKVTISNLPRSVEYHWQARVKDSNGGFSNWVTFGGNTETERDVLLAGLPVSIAIASGNSQSGVVYNTLGSSLAAKVSDASGFGVPGATVTWAVTNNKVGGALLDGVSSQTNAEGIAVNRYKLGQKTGVNNVTATAKNAQDQHLVNSPVTFSLTGTPDVIYSFTASGPTYSITNQAFNLTITGYDQYNNVKTDYTGTPLISAVLSSDTSENGTGTLSVSSYTFLSGDNGVKILSMSYDTKESIKIKIFDNPAVGYSNAIAIVDVLGSCPDADGIIDISARWDANITNQGLFDCRNVPEVKITAGATLTLASYYTNDGNFGNDFGITVLANAFTVDNGSFIVADYLGYPSAVASSAASHGGFSKPDSAPYGSIFQPITLGSGGANGYYGSGGAGGGAIHLITTGNSEINGIISSNGASKSGNSADSGAGGSIWLETDTLSGSGLLQVNAGPSGGGSYCGSCAGGSGGRIAVYYNQNNGFTLDSPHLQAYGGSGNYGWGGAGTVYIENKGADPVHGGTLLVDNNNNSGLNAGVPQGDYSFSNIEVSRYGNVEFMGNSSTLRIADTDSIVGDPTKPLIKIDGTLTYTGTGVFNIEGFDLGVNGRTFNIGNVVIGSSESGGMSFFPHNWYYTSPSSSYDYGGVTVAPYGTITVYAYQNGVTANQPLTYADDYGINLSLASLDVANGGRIVADLHGYPSGTAYSSAAHGGFSKPNSVPYGNIYEPVTLGSGGTDGYYGTPGAGGGAIHLNVAGSSVINGIITSNGGSKADNAADSGAGGSIWLDTDTISGSGSMQVNAGPTGGGSYCGSCAGGSGGRIAVYYNENNGFTFNGIHLQAYGGNGNYGWGGAGTVYIEHKNVDTVHGGTLLVDNNNNSGLNAGVPEDTYLFSKINVTRYGHVEFIGQNSLLQLTDSNAFLGDSTKPLIKTSGTLRYLGQGRIMINGVDLAINGKVEGINDITIGDTSQEGMPQLPSGMTLYAKNWYYNNTNGYVFGDLIIKQYGIMTLIPFQNGVTPGNPSTLADDYGVNLTLSGLTINTGGKITSDTYGYPASVAYSTAAHGGFSHGYGSGGTPYGNVYEPITLGSGGTDAYYGAPAPGGGAMRLIVNGASIIDGSIQSNGGVGTCHAGEGGAGGSVWLETTTISGSGSIQTNGGNGCGDPGGSGGRVALYYNTNSDFVLDGLHLQSYGANQSGPGTVYIEHVDVNPIHGGILLVDNNNQNSMNAGVPEGNYLFTKINVTRYGHVEFMGQNSLLQLSGSDAFLGDSTKSAIKVDGTLEYLGGDRLMINGVDITINGRVIGINDVTICNTSEGVTPLPSGMTLYAKNWYYNNTNGYVFGDLIIGQYGIMTLIPYQNGVTPGNPSTLADDYGVNLTLSGLTINTGGQITSDTYGYPAGVAYSTAAHGGFSHGYGSGGTPYGNVYEPITLGSGGTDAYYGAAAPGGGAMHLIVNGTSIIDGIIKANGGVGVCYAGEGGAGGSIWLETTTISGSGSIQTNGGNGCGDPGGSGGRLALYYTTNSSFVLDSSHLQSYGANQSGPGTVYVEHVDVNPVHGGILLIDNNNQNSLNAGILSGDYQFASIKLKKYGNVTFTDQNTTVSLTSSSGLEGDSTKPKLIIEGTLSYLGGDNLTIDGVDLAPKGNMVGIGDVTIGATLPTTVTLYANSWKRTNRADMEAYPFTFGAISLDQYGSILSLGYENGDSDWTNDYETILDATSINMASGSIINISGYGLSINATDLIVNHGASINANLAGYLAGPGGGNGASYGGYNGAESSPVYGDLFNPVQPGSGGVDGSYGGKGGGLIKINLTGLLTNNGSILANGGNSGTYCGIYCHTAGAGSGGGINIVTNTFNGTGTITANGGQGAQIGDSGIGPAGGGGRIAIRYNDGNYPLADSTKIQARGALGPSALYNSGPGTIYVKQGASYGDLLINNAAVTNGISGPFIAQNYYFDNVTISGNSEVGLVPDIVNGRGTRLYVEDQFILDLTSKINGIGKGFPHAQGLGKGNNGVASGGGGGGAHGGSGGEAEAAGGDIATGGIPYGDQLRPYTLGSGGGSSGEGTFGGEGGGAFAIISLSGQVYVAGTINVSGTNGLASSPGGGGGAGGSILVLARTCSISGNLTAAGGTGGDGSEDGGGGGGGRISILNNGGTCGATGTISVFEGLSIDGVDGGPGTYNGIIMLPQVDAADQFKLNDQIIDVGGTTDETSVKIKVNVSNPAASMQDPKILKAQIEVAPIAEDFTQVLGTSVVTTNSQNYAGGQSVEVNATVPNLIPGESYKWQVRVLDDTDGINGEWISYGNNGNAADFVVSETTELRASVTDTNVSVGDPVSFRISAYDIFGNIDTNYSGLVDFSVTPIPSIDPYLPLSYQFSSSDSGTKEFTGSQAAVFFVSGTYRIVATDRNDPSLTVMTDEIVVSGVMPTATPTSVPTTVPPTNTPIVTVTQTPTGGPTPTLTPVITDNVTPTPTTIDNTPTVNPTVTTIITSAITTTVAPTATIVPVTLEITDVQITQIQTNAVICWKTNLLATGYVEYGIDPNAYSSRTLYEEVAVNNHCQTLILEGESTLYYYKIYATGPNGEQADYTGSFEVIISVLPPTGEDSCKINSPIITGDNTNGYIISFNTDNNDNVACTIVIGENTNNLTDQGLLVQRQTDYFSTNILSSLLPKTDTLQYKLECKSITKVCSFSSKIDLNWPGNPIKETLTDIAATSVAKAAAVGMVGLATATFALSNPQILWMGLLWFYRRSKKNRFGLVYDKDTKQIVPFAVIRLLDTITERVIVQTVSDLQGRYHLLGGEGQYILEASQDGYATWRLSVTLSGKDLQITNNIGLSKSKLSTSKKFSLRKLARKLNNYIFVFGFAFSLLMLLLNFYIVNVIIILIYMFQIVIILLQRPPRYWGRVIEAGTGRAIKGAFISILDTVEQRQVDVQITDAQGRFGLLLEKQEYLLKASFTGYKPKSINKSWEKVVLPGGDITYLIPKGEVNDLDIEMESV